MRVAIDSTAASAPSAASLIDHLARSEEVRDHQMTDGTFAVTYAEVPGLLRRLDALFSRRGVSRRHPVALECSQSIAGALAILYVMSRDLSVVLLPDLTGRIKEAAIQRFIPGFCRHVVTAVEGDRRKDGDFPENCLRVEANEGFVEEPVVAAFDTPDLYLRTSGSTGTPKLARMSHQKWLDNALPCLDRWELSGRDRFAVPVPIFHSYGFGAAFLPGLLAGASMDLQSGFNVMRYLEREAAFEPDVAFLTPQLCDMFLKVRRSDRPYRLSVTAGDKIRKATVAAYEPRFGPLLNLYGSAEMGAVSVASPQAPPPQRLGTAGYPLPGIELEVGEAGDEAPSGQTGALRCRQKNGFAGYLVREESGWRYERRGDDEWFTTGDLARIRDDGYLELVGRTSLSVKRDGLPVVFADVETAMEGIEGLTRVVVFAHGESRRGGRMVAACLADGKSAPDVNEIRKKCFEKLPRYAVPDEIVVVGSLPLLPSGKVDRRALPDLI